MKNYLKSAGPTAWRLIPLAGCLLAYGLLLVCHTRAGAQPLQRLAVSANRHFLIKEDGTPFFWLADTGWELFNRLTQEEAFMYLEDRAKKGFTVIQAVAPGVFRRPNEANPPFLNEDPLQPVETYFQKVDAVIDKATSLGLYVALTPIWGDRWNGKYPNMGPEILTPENARAYGEWIKKRYRTKPIIWVMGGDRPIETPKHRAIVEAMVAGVRAGDTGHHLMTFHNWGEHSSSEYFQDAPWLDFNMWQSGHEDENNPVYDWIRADYDKQPTKPSLDGEPPYENHPINWDPKNRCFDDYDVRKSAYWALFAGACGHTYGCNDVWQFYAPPSPPILNARTPWQQALQLSGASQMIHVRNLLESRPMLSRIPDQSILASEPGVGGEHVQAIRAEDGSYAFVYLPTGQPVAVKMSVMAGKQSNVHWFNPRTGIAEQAGRFATKGVHRFVPPTHGPKNDWILVLDDATRHFSAPGQK